MGSTRTSILEILRNASSSLSVLRSCGSALPGRLAQVSHLWMLWRHSPHARPGFSRDNPTSTRGMKLRTGESNHRHEKIVLASAIAHNVNNFHQVAGVGLRCADPREKWTPIMTACRLARIQLKQRRLQHEGTDQR